MDFLSDPNPVVLHRYLLACEPLPSYLADAAPPTLEKVASMVETEFADPTRREYPVDSKASTLIGSIYAHFGPDKDTPHGRSVRSALAKSAAFWGITQDIENGIDLLEAEMVKKAFASSGPDRYALIVEEPEGLTGYWPLNSYLDVVDSAVRVADQIRIGGVRDTHLHKAASAIVERAGELGVGADSIPAKVLAFGEPRLPDFEKAARWVEARAEAGIPEEGLALYRELVKSAAEATSGSDLSQWCETMEDLDQHFKVAYSATQPSPHDLLYSGSRIADVQAALSEYVLLGEGEIFPLPLLKMAAVDWPIFFRTEAAEAIAKAASSEGPRDATLALRALDQTEQYRFLHLLVAAL